MPGRFSNETLWAWIFQFGEFLFLTTNLIFLIVTGLFKLSTSRWDAVIVFFEEVVSPEFEISGGRAAYCIPSYPFGVWGSEG